MGFHHLDHYAAVASPVTRTAPAARVVGAVGMALSASLIPPGAWGAMAAALGLAFGVALAARIPPGVLLARASVPLGLLVLASAGLLFMAPGSVVAGFGPLKVTDRGVVLLVSALGRGAAAVVSGVVLVSTTPFPELVAALRELRLPRAVTSSLALAYRFLVLLGEEVARVRRAAQVRNGGRGRVAVRRLAVGMAAAAFARSYDRSERVFRAMRVRGYRDSVPSLAYRGMDPASALRVGGLLTVAAALVVAARA
ncbi:MAG: cobalt ECF transporter T component CbiQ [Longimicrobiales bacterium]|nr:cobalt ECF transporter T component CbiQ [Longimicrobiales bacterium]